MDEIKKIWEAVKNSLHYGPTTLPLWQEVITKLHDFEARIQALESGAAPEIEKAVTEQIVNPEQNNAADSATDSTAIGDKADPAYPAALPEPTGTGTDRQETHEGE